MKRPDIFLRHIIDEINYLLQNSKALEDDKFITDETLKRSFVRSLEVIGEATKNLPDDFNRLTFLVEDPELREGRGKAGRKTMEESYFVKFWSPRISK